MKKRRVNIGDIERQRYYQLPKFLFDDDYKGLNNDARVLYSILLDRMSLSQKNGWQNERGEVFLLYTQENMADKLSVSITSIKRGMKALTDTGLLEQQRQGLNRPNMIFLLTIGEPEVPENHDLAGQTKSVYPDRSDPTTGQTKSDYPEGSDLPASKTDFNNTDFSKADTSEENLCSSSMNASAFSQIQTTDSQGSSFTLEHCNSAPLNQPNASINMPQSTPQNMLQGKSSSSQKPKAMKTNKEKSANTAHINKHFDLFWQEYPRKVGKQAALKAWQKLKPDENTLTEIMRGLDIAIRYWKARCTEMQYIPHASTWLSGARWNDNLDAGATLQSSNKGSNPFFQGFQQNNDITDALPPDDVVATY